MDNPEKLAILGTKDTRRRQTKQKRQHIMCGEHYAIYKISRERNRKLFKDLLQMCIENTRMSLIFTKYI
jgi:hypothetical protein